MAAYLTDSKRKSFEAMFTDLSEARDSKEDIARVAFALSEPMLEPQKAMNLYKRRLAHALETSNTAFGLAAVYAFQRELVACAVRGGATAPALANARDTLLRRAAGIASSGAFTQESDLAPSPMAARRFMQEFEAWLDENLETMDAEIAAGTEDEASPAPAPR